MRRRIVNFSAAHRYLGRREVGRDGKARWFEEGIMKKKKKMENSLDFSPESFPRCRLRSACHISLEYGVRLFHAAFFHSSVSRRLNTLLAPSLNGCSLFFFKRRASAYPSVTRRRLLIPSLFRRSGEDTSSGRGERRYLETFRWR